MSDIISSLKQSDVFIQFTQTQLELVANLCQEKFYSDGEIVFEEKQKGTQLYIIVQGEVEIQINSSAGKAPTISDTITIATLRRGQSFGEIALVDQGLRSATAVARGKSIHLFVIPREGLIMLCETYPHLGYRMMYNLAADLAVKLRNTDLMIREKILYTPVKS